MKTLEWTLRPTTHRNENMMYRVNVVCSINIWDSLDCDFRNEIPGEEVISITISSNRGTTG